MVLVRYIVGLTLLAMSMISCDQNSLQQYLVDKQDDNKFVKVDLATSLLEGENNSLSQDQRDILKSVRKVNVVAYPMKGNKEEYKTEHARLSSIMDNEKYQLLTKYTSNNTKATLKYVGDDDTIDEVIVFASNEDTGFAVFRLLGDNMKPNDMMKLMNAMRSGDMDLNKLSGLNSIFDSDSI